MFSSCFGLRKSPAEEREPLLPRYGDDTSLQRQLHQKLHTYQMLRAMSKGYMPSNEQVVVNLRTLLAVDLLNPDNEGLSDSGQALVHYTKQWLKQFVELLQNKNGEDQIQDFIWSLSNARLSVDMEAIAQGTSRAKAKADVASAYKSIQTVGSLLLTNSDFRLLLSDLNTVGREVFKDTAFTLSQVSEEAGKRLEPSQAEQDALKEPGADASQQSTQKDLQDQTAEVSNVLADGASEVAQGMHDSVTDKIEGPEKDTLVSRLKQAVLKLRERPDYTDSVSTISLLLRRYAMVYCHAARDAAQTAEENIDTNEETNRALSNFWSFVRSFGDPEEWDALEKRFGEVMSRGQSNPQFDDFVQQMGNALQDMLTDPSFFDNVDQRFQELRAESRQLTSDSPLREEIDGLLGQIQSTFRSVLRDQDIARLLQTTERIAKILSPTHEYVNGELVTDSIHVFVPLAIQAIQCIPIPRLEVSTPQIDILLENLILEPGVTINNSSFLPYKLRIETYNDLEIRKARFRATSATKSLVRIKLDGISVRAEEIGFWLRLHTGLFRLAEEGIASFELDERGIDIQLDVEVGKDRLEKILSLRSVRVHIHKLDYKLRKSRFAFLAWVLKPLLSRVVRKAVETQIASAIADALHVANRELVFARERLRATRISDPADLQTFVKAVAARLVPPEDPDSYSRVGVADPGRGVFKGRYAPGSIVKVWNEEAAQAPRRIREQERDGWRNDIFDVHVNGIM